MTSKNDRELELYTQELWDTIIRIIHNFRAVNPGEDLEITFPQAMMLMELHSARLVSMSELSQRLRISQGVATRMVDRLLEKGLLERKRDTADRRVVLVSTSRRGDSIAREIGKVNRQKLRELLEAVPESKRAELLELLKGLERKFEQSTG